MRVIIVDDEAPSRAELKYFVEKSSKMVLEHEFDNAIDALSYVEDHGVDCVFLDVNMPKLDGIGLAKIINRMKDQPLIVFVTAHKDFAIEAFEVEAFDYLLKPFSEERILKTIKKLEAMDKQSHTLDKLTVWKNEVMQVLKCDDILFCQACERSTRIYTIKEQFVVNMTISEFSKRLSSEIFFRSHRSYLINLNQIYEIVPWFNNTYVLKFEGRDEEVPVSRGHMKLFKQVMHIE